MAPQTRRSRVFVNHVVDPNLADFNREIKLKYSKMKRVHIQVRAKKAKHFKVPKVKLQNATDRVLPALNRNDEHEAYVCSIQEAAQNLRHIDEQRVIPPLNEAHEAFIRSLKEAAQNLKPVAGYRLENGVVIID